MNTAEKIMNLRNTSRKKTVYLTKEKRFTPTHHLKIQFYTNKQKQILASLSRAKKINLSLYEKIYTLSQNKETKVFDKFIENLTKQILVNQETFRKINKVYKFLLRSSEKFRNEKNLSTSSRVYAQILKIKRKKLNTKWKVLKKKIKSIARKKCLKKELPNFALDIFSKSFKSNSEFTIPMKNSLGKDIIFLNFIFSQILKEVSLQRNGDFLAN
jgi:hypothetical protein